MLVLGLLLMGASGAFAGLLIAYNTASGPAYQVSMFGDHLITVSTREVFFAGLALALVFCFGLLLMRTGARVRHARVVRMREARRGRGRMIGRGRTETPSEQEYGENAETARIDGDATEEAPRSRTSRRRHLLGARS